MVFFHRLKKPDPEAEQKLRGEIENNGGLEKSDFPAMIISALLVIMPVALIILALLILFAWAFVSC